MISVTESSASSDSSGPNPNTMSMSPSVSRCCSRWETPAQKDVLERLTARAFGLVGARLGCWAVMAAISSVDTNHWMCSLSRSSALLSALAAER